MAILEVILLIIALILLASNIFIWFSVSKNINLMMEKLNALNSTLSSISERLANIKSYQCLNPCSSP